MDQDARQAAIIGIDPWLETPPGQYLLGWEQAQLDRVVADVFGFHALQLGCPGLQALRHNRMPHRWLLTDGSAALPHRPLAAHAEAAAALPVSIHADFDALPFPAASLDLVVLPHTLEFARDAHHTLREVERVLVPEGRVIVTGFNPASLWGLRLRSGSLGTRLGWGSPFGPADAELLGWRRLRDWLRLLGCEVEEGGFGCYRPAFDSQRWLDRCHWMDRAGERWWPVLGGVYFLMAVKRVRGMRLVGRVKRPRVHPASTAPAVVAQGLPRILPVCSDAPAESLYESMVERIE